MCYSTGYDQVSFDQTIWMFSTCFVIVGISNSRRLELLSLGVHKSPSMLKQRVGTSKTYIRPLQCNLDLTPIEINKEVVCLLALKCL